MRILGVTGKIGVGKSTVCAIMARLGAKVIDADKVVSALYEQGCAGATKIRHFFGEDFLLKNGRVNNRKLRATVFHDEKKLSILEKMIHPLVTHEIQ
ncbi:dephospho-CoA kinase, partial [Candidatus Peregrinibacteria bacterium]|nr:dephospho-CoA kinase [Candidatus Peregrinibacteria bacterium]